MATRDVPILIEFRFCHGIFELKCTVVLCDMQMYMIIFQSNLFNCCDLDLLPGFTYKSKWIRVEQRY